MNKDDPTMPDTTGIDTSPLRAAWQATWAGLGLTPRPALLDELLQRHAEPHRHYHSTQHLLECLGHMARIQALAAHPAEVLIALWFHDAIYDTQRHDNEALSAEWARQALREAGGDDALAERVAQLVMATQHRVEPATADEQVLVDVDLSILGAPPERFAQYEAQIQAEYAWVPTPLFAEKRREVLAGFLARPRLYATQAFSDLYDAPARTNLRRALQTLSC